MEGSVIPWRNAASHTYSSSRQRIDRSPSGVSRTTRWRAESVIQSASREISKYWLLRIVESPVLAVWRFARFSAAEMAGWYRAAIPLVREKLDKPCLVLNFFVQNSCGHVVSSRVLSKGHVANGGPASDRAPLRLEQQRQNVNRGWRIGKLRGCAAGLIVKCLQIVWQATAKLIDARNDQLPMRPVFEPGVLANFLVIFMTREMHSQDRVVIICTRKLGGGVCHQKFD